MKEIKLFTEKQIQVSAFFGGPISVGILFYQNFKRLNKKRQGWLALTLSTILIGLIAFSLLANPEGIIARLPKYTLPFFYTVFSYLAYHFYMRKPIQEANEYAQVNKASNWTVFGLSLAGLIPSLAILFAIAWFTPEFVGTYKSYGKNRIYYSGYTSSDQDLDRLAQFMTDFGYFEPNFPYEIKVEKTDEYLEITVPYLATSWKDADEMAIIEREAQLMQMAFQRPVIMILRDYSRNGDFITKRINDPNINE